MPTITVETRIHAPIELCFDLARDVDVHVQTSGSTGERAVAGRTTGLLELGDTVTFEGIHLGIRQRLTAKIVEMERPRRFVDEMVKGAFSSLRHVHEFAWEPPFTVMRDTIQWKSPLGVLGVLADRIIVERHLRGFITRKQQELRRIAEARATKP